MQQHRGSNHLNDPTRADAAKLAALNHPGNFNNLASRYNN